MKRRDFIQSASAGMASIALTPPLSLSALTPASTAAMSQSYTPFMQANALAILRNKGAMSLSEFGQATGLNPAQIQSMLGRFAKLGWIENRAFQTGSIQAIRPDWMKSPAKLPNSINAAKQATQENPDKILESRQKKEPPMQEDFYKQDASEFETVQTKVSDNFYSDEKTNPTDATEAEQDDETQKIPTIHEQRSSDGDHSV